MKLYKILRDGKSCNGGNAVWSLPNGSPGGWMEPLEDIEMCEWGYHLVDKTKILSWMGKSLYEAEASGEIISRDGKYVASTCRLIREVEKYNRDTIADFAIWAVEQVISRSNPHLQFLKKFQRGRYNQDLFKVREEIETEMPVMYSSQRNASRALHGLTFVVGEIKNWWEWAASVVASCMMAEVNKAQIHRQEARKAIIRQEYNAQLLKMIGED